MLIFVNLVRSAYRLCVNFYLILYLYTFFAFFFLLNVVNYSYAYIRTLKLISNRDLYKH